jgi:hypothetical protein
MFSIRTRVKLLMCSTLMVTLSVLAPRALALPCFLLGGYPCFCYSVDSGGYWYCTADNGVCNYGGSCY